LAVVAGMKKWPCTTDKSQTLKKRKEKYSCWVLILILTLTSTKETNTHIVNQV